MRAKIYISIPITGRPLEKLRHEADLVKRMLSGQGYDPVNPFDIYAGKNAEWEDHMAADIRALMKCDGIYMCPGWGNSLGCNMEFQIVRLMNHYADRYGLRKKMIFYGR